MNHHRPLFLGLAVVASALFAATARPQVSPPRLNPAPPLNPAPLSNPAPPPVNPALQPLTERELLRLIAADLDKAKAEDRPNLRYFFVAPVLKAILDLDAAQDSLSMSINSLSWAKTTVRVIPVGGSAGRVFRMNLSDYQRFDGSLWDAALWKQILDRYPYGIIHQTDSAAQTIATQTKCKIAYIRADWFAYAATRPPLYHDLLGLPETVATLERRLGVDVEANIDAGIASRAGFNRSSAETDPVSGHNRLIERHSLPATDGDYYWKSYDFADNSPARGKDLFSSPLGPVGVSKSVGHFRHDGMEIIFSLPNRLQGYMIANGHGDRLDQAPVTIVRDNLSYPPLSPSVTNGFSCIRCHGAGLNPTRWDKPQKRFLSLVENQVRTHVENNQNAFPADLEKILKLYKEDTKLRNEMEKDITRFTEAFMKGAPKSAAKHFSVYYDPLGWALEYDLDLTRAAAEIGLESREFQKNLQQSPEIARRLGFLMVGEKVKDPSVNHLVLRGGTVKRQVFEETFPTMVRAWGYAGYPPTEVAPAHEAPDSGEGTQDKPVIRPSSTYGLKVVLGAAFGGLVFGFLVGVRVGRVRSPMPVNS